MFMLCCWHSVSIRGRGAMYSDISRMILFPHSVFYIYHPFHNRYLGCSSYNMFENTTKELKPTTVWYPISNISLVPYQYHDMAQAWSHSCNVFLQENRLTSPSLKLTGVRCILKKKRKVTPVCLFVCLPKTNPGTRLPLQRNLSLSKVLSIK